jgi:hypothetical protein
MSNKIRTKCPGCQATLQLAEELRGKQISCPKCQKQFRLPGMSIKDVPMAIPIASEVEEPVPMALPVVGNDPPVERFRGGPETVAPRPTGPVSTSGSAAKTSATSATDPKLSDWATPSDTETYTASAATFEKEKGYVPDMSDVDSKLFSSGVTLLFVPLAASVLPFLGLQIKFLIGLGALAPLVGILFGLLGSVMIVIARRNQGDAVFMGATSGMLTIGFGVLGCFAAVLYEPKSLNLSWFEIRHREWSELEEEARTKQGNGIPVIATPETPRTFSPGSDAVNPLLGSPATTGNGGTDAASSNPLLNSASSSTPPATSVPIVTTNPEIELKQDKDAEFKLLSKGSNGLLAFQRRKSSSGNIEGSIEPLNLVGKKTNSGELYEEFGVKAVGASARNGYLEIVPIELTETEFLHAVRPKVGEVLYGLRLSFDKDQIVGFQGIFRNLDDDSERETHWVGVESESKETSLNPEPGITGVVVFKSGLAPVGFGWVNR